MPKRSLGFFILQVLFCLPSSYAEEILVAVASNFSAPMEQIAEEFEKQSGHEVSLVFGSSGRLFAQIQNGAPFQLFFSADEEKPQRLEEADAIVAGSRFTYVTGSLILWSANTALAIDGPEVLDSNFRRLALANSTLAPYGRAAEEALEYFGKTAATRARWVRGENIAQTYQFVETGNADLGFIALSQVSMDGKILRGTGWKIPADSHMPIRQDAVQIKHAEHCGACNEFMTFMTSSFVAETVERFGYQVD